MHLATFDNPERYPLKSLSIENRNWFPKIIISWTVNYPVDSIIQRLNNLGLDKMCSHVKPAFNFVLISNFLCFLVLGLYHL